MEKSQTEFMQECLAEIAALKEKIAALEEKLQAYQQAPAPEEEVDFTDIQIGVEEDRSFVAPAPQEDIIPDESPVILSEEKNLPSQENASDQTANLPWRKDKPGIPVKNIRSGISLLDRALFIGTLFKEDFALYDQTIAQLNGMESLDQAVQYIKEHFPEWDMKSDVVYHFMMSIRKKLG